MINSFLRILLICFITQGAKCQNFNWAKSLAGRGISTLINLSPGTSYCQGIAVDRFDNVYITGFCNDSVDFDPGPLTDFHIGGNDDIYFAKYDSNGNLIWAHVLQSNGWNYSYDIAIDDSNNIIIAGECSSDADFDPGPGVANLVVNPGNSNYIFIAKYDSNGNFIWAENMQSSTGSFIHSLCVDKQNNIYITGDFYDAMDFDPGINTAILTSNHSGLFFAKYNSAGEYKFASALPGTGNLSSGNDIRCSDNGNIFIAGIFGNTVDFDPGPGTFNITAGTTCDRYIAKYDSTGNFLWANSINTNNNGVTTVGRSIRIAIDQNENAIATGDFSSTVDFDPGPSSAILNSPGTYGTFICKYDDTGNFLWVKGLTGGHCVSSDIEIDCHQNLILTGTFFSADFDPGPGSMILSSTAPSAFMNFFASYNSSGDLNWARQIGNDGYAGSVIHTTLAIKEDHQYIAGGFKQTGDFDPGSDSSFLTSSGVGENSFFAKYYSNVELNLGNDTIVCKEDTVKLNASLPGSYLWQDNSTSPEFLVTEAGLYWVSVTDNQCSYTDSIYIKEKSCDTSKIKMPNVFTPNGDFKNDFFKPIEAENINQYQLSIYNRWGMKIFSTDNFEEGWNGIYNDQLCNDGTYYYVLKYTFNDDTEKSLHGYLTLIR